MLTMALLPHRMGSGKNYQLHMDSQVCNTELGIHSQLPAETVFKTIPITLYRAKMSKISK